MGKTVRQIALAFFGLLACASWSRAGGSWFDELIRRREAPGTGKALPVMRGQILRFEQLGNGQCADFNAFNLHDHKEYFHTGRTRHLK